jgi:hypothetical protein
VLLLYPQLAVLKCYRYGNGMAQLIKA